MDLYSEDLFHGAWYILDGFIVLDVEQCDVFLNSCFSLNASFNNNDIDVWHVRVGYIGQDRMNKLATEGPLGSISKMDLRICEHYLIGKVMRKSFAKETRVEFMLQLIHFDICGLMNARARYGACIS